MINSIINNNIVEAKSNIFAIMNGILTERLEDVKQYAIAGMFESVEQIDETQNVIRLGRTKLIRRRIRRKNGKIVVQRNIRRSAVKGFTLRGGKIKRITAMQKITMKRAQRRGAIKRRAHKQQILRRRMISIRRRKSLGIR